MLFILENEDNLLKLSKSPFSEQSMPTYLIVDIEITDPNLYEEVKRRTPATIAAYGGRYLARGSGTQTVDGQWTPKRIVLLEFESLDRAKAWLTSPEYRPVRELRDRSAVVHIVAVEGLDRQPV